MNQFSRTESLIGKNSLNKLKSSKVAIFGIGGVGSFVAEGLARSGIGNFLLIDNDTINETNINRQIHANINTIGKYKVDVMKERILEINPNASVETIKIFYTSDTEEKIIDETFNYVVDAIDTVSGKIKIIEESKKVGIPIISCMGTGNKLEPTKLEVTDIEKTTVCPLARVIRQEMKKRNIKKLKVVYSKESPIKTATAERIPSSIAFVPSVAGMIIAGEVVKDIIKTEF